LGDRFSIVHLRPEIGQLFHSLDPETEKARFPNSRFEKFPREEDQSSMEASAYIWLVAVCRTNYRVVVSVTGDRRERLDSS